MDIVGDSRVSVVEWRYANQESVMLNSIKKLNGFRILASDGEVGAVAESVYFDDEQWVVRYLVVDTRTWLNGRNGVVVNDDDRVGNRIGARGV